MRCRQLAALFCPAERRLQWEARCHAAYRQHGMMPAFAGMMSCRQLTALYLAAGFGGGKAVPGGCPARRRGRSSAARPIGRAGSLPARRWPGRGMRRRRVFPAAAGDGRRQRSLPAARCAVPGDRRARVGGGRFRPGNRRAGGLPGRNGAAWYGAANWRHGSLAARYMAGRGMSRRREFPAAESCGGGCMERVSGEAPKGASRGACFFPAGGMVPPIGGTVSGAC